MVLAVRAHCIILGAAINS